MARAFSWAGTFKINKIRIANIAVITSIKNVTSSVEEVSKTPLTIGATSKIIEPMLLLIPLTFISLALGTICGKKALTAGLVLALLFILSTKLIAQNSNENILIILDLSRSMNEYINKHETKMDVARDSVKEVIQALSDDIKIGLRVYGHKSGFLGMNQCSQSKLVVPVEQNNKKNILDQIDKLDPSGVTPIEYSLRKALGDLKNVEGPKRIILITDGLETCGGNPCSFAGDIASKHPDIKVDVISFGRNVKNVSLDSQLQCISLKTSGRFSRADTQAELVKSINSSVQVDKSIYWQVKPNY